jgi:hypothetical protein
VHETLPHATVPTYQVWVEAARGQRPLKDDEQQSTSALVGLAARWLLGCVLFVPLWAGMNFVFGTALDGPIGAFVMEPPCQRLARTTEPLRRYTLGGGKSRLSGSVCHFASGARRVDGPTDGLGFTGRELAYLVVGFIGYGACFAAALALTVVVAGAGQRRR